MVNVVVVDDHLLVREGVTSLLRRTEDVRVTATFGDGRDFLRGARTLDRIDVLLLDITMQHSDGMDVLRRLQTWRNPPRVLFLSMHPERRFAAEAMRLGAHGYVTKDADDETLLTAIRTVASGGTYLSATGNELLLRPEPASGSEGVQTTGFGSLSDQELRVLRLLKQGLTVKEIAFDLEVSSSTVSTYKTRLMTKLGARTLVDLLQYDT